LATKIKMTDTLIILQARTSSTRLPNKVLLPILGKPMLSHQLARLAKVKTPHKLIVATSTLASDNPIAALCKQLNINCFRGSLDDVLERYYQAALTNNSDGKVKNIVRVTGDCPLIDSNIVDRVIRLFLLSQVDYCSNCEPATLPDGLDVEVFSFEALKKSNFLAKKPSEREHVTAFIRNNPDTFKRINYSHTSDLSYYRWTVDEPEDFDLINKIYQALYKKKPYFTLTDILELLQQQPELTKINQHYNRNEGLIKSLIKDKELGYE
jgi:spore coat polysaccharide biosynthesis protein SpsF